MLQLGLRTLRATSAGQPVGRPASELRYAGQSSELYISMLKVSMKRCQWFAGAVIAIVPACPAAAQVVVIANGSA